MIAKSIIRTWTIMLALIVSVSCEKSTILPEIEIDHNIQIGESKVYLNGNIEMDYSVTIQYIELYNTLIFSFQEEPEEWLWNTLSFSGINRENGRYSILSSGTIAGPPNTRFKQTYQEDLQGYTYKLIKEDEAYFELIEIDTIKQEVKGSFKAIFERTSKNGHSDLGLPKTLLFQGVFYESYEHL